MIKAFNVSLRMEDGCLIGAVPKIRPLHTSGSLPPQGRSVPAIRSQIFYWQNDIFFPFDRFHSQSPDSIRDYPVTTVFLVKINMD